LTNVNSFSVGVISVNGGLGKSFVYTVTAALPNESFLSGSELNISTPTCTITGVAARRVSVGVGSLNITNSTPTLTDASFFQTAVNGNLSTFTGTRLGTDGLSGGFIAQAPAQKFLVLGFANAEVNTAIWALTSGGATSVNNYPLPQDTIIIDSASGSGTLSFTNAIAYFGSITVVSPANSFTFSASVQLYGNYICGLSLGTIAFGTLALNPSGITSRTLTLNGSTTTVTTFYVQPRSTDSLNFIGTNSATLSGWGFMSFSFGNIVLSPTVALTGSVVSQFIANATVDGSGTISARQFAWGLTANVLTTNYTVRLYNNGTYTNNATTIAKNGSVTAIGAAAAIGTTSTTATNPLVELRFQNTVPANVTTITLNGNTFVQNLTSGNSTASNTARLVGAAGRTITKTNGGNLGVTALRVTDVRASPASTFYAVAPNSSLVGDTTGWTLGTPPTAPSGGLLLF
jgi:hypothetical protein